MRLNTPSKAIDFKSHDIFGEPFRLSGLHGNRVMLSFFRDAACPFCNYRIYELTKNYAEWKEKGLEIVVVFSDTPEQVRKYVAKRPRPFTMICDPTLTLYNRYGVEKSALSLVKAILFRLPEIIRGFVKGAKPTNNPHVTIVPADFLIDIDGTIVDLFYGRTTADHIPMERLHEFGSKESIQKSRKMIDEMRLMKSNNDQRIQALRK